MPSGIPPSISTLAKTIQTQTSSIITYLQIPSYNDTSAQFQIAFHDSIRALQSTTSFVKLVGRPLFILLALLSKYVLIVLKVLAEHTVYHAIIAAKELGRQCRSGIQWFIVFQRGLSRTAVWMEIGFIGFCIGLYMIRRYLQRKRYFQKFTRWYQSKKRRAQMKYNIFVETVAQTSIILALLLPHILYITCISILKYFTPSLVEYLSTKTILSDVISFYIPFVKTIVVVCRYKQICMVGERETRESSDDSTAVTSQKDKNTATSGYFSFLQRKRTHSDRDKKTNVIDAYEKAVSKRNTDTTSTSRKKQQQKQVTQTFTSMDTDHLNDIAQEAAELLKYWVVYAILIALVQTATSVPILGRIFYNANPTNAKKAAASVSRWSSRGGRKQFSLLDKVKISTRIIEESKLFFFAWLLLLPISLTSLNRQQERNGDDKSRASLSSPTGSSSSISTSRCVKNRIKSIEKQSKTATLNQKSTSIHRKTSKIAENKFSNQPLDIMYERLVPIAISFVSTSTNALNITVGNNNTEATALDSFKTKVAVFFQTMLSAMVWTKLISESTKNFIVNTFSQCRQLLPAAMTLVMPSYFTSYGVIYVRLVVPCANSSIAYEQFQRIDNDLAGEHKMIVNDDGFIDDRWISVSLSIIQYLQYWTIQAILSSLLQSFAPALAWIPFSTHLVWLLWAYVQLQANTSKLYDIMEWDLKAFGILKTDLYLSPLKDYVDESQDGKKKPVDIKDTATMQFVTSMLKKIPAKGSSSNLEKTEVIDDERLESSNKQDSRTKSAKNPKSSHDMNEKIINADESSPSEEWQVADSD